MDVTNVAKALPARGFKVSSFETAKEAAEYLNTQIDGATVGFGGSITLEELGLYALLSGHNTVFSHWHLPEGGDAASLRAQAAGSEQLRVHIREAGSMEGLDFVLRRGYHLALLRYAEEDEDYYHRYCDRHGLHREPVMEFEYRLLTNREGPLAKCEVTDITQLNSYMEVLHGDFQLPGGEDSGLRWHTNPNRRIHVYERCSQFSILQNLPNAYMWASPMPKRALEQYHLVLRKCPAQRQRMKDVLVYPDRGTLRPEEQTFVQLLHKQAALTVK